jgi:K+-sensing histidine kinase KdpD
LSGEPKTPRHLLPYRPKTNLDGEGATWAVGAFVASLLIGLLIEPFRGTIGLENVVILYLLVVVAAAAIGGRAAGMVAALSAALAYDYFLTTPYHTLVIDSLAQVITVVLLVVTGTVASIGGRVRRRSAAIAEAHADAVRLLHRVTETAAAGGAVDRVAAEGLQRLLGARRVSVIRRSPAGFVVTVDVGDIQPPLDLEALTHLDREGRIPMGHQRVLGGTMVLPLEGVALDLVARQHPIGYLVVIPGHDVPADRTIRLAVAAMANELAIAATEQSQR